jgi:multidrug efflux pump subunit AcrA (membrane-fusion protein)
MQRIRALVLGAPILASSACRGDTPAAAAEVEPPLVTVQVVQTREITEWDEYLGRFEAVKTVEIRSRVEGYLQEIRFVDGQVVDQGDLLFVIDPRPFEARRAFAVASVAEATSDLERSWTWSSRRSRARSPAASAGTWRRWATWCAPTTRC